VRIPVFPSAHAVSQRATSEGAKVPRSSNEVPSGDATGMPATATEMKQVHVTAQVDKKKAKQ
jgi:hypothetical protein